MSSENDENEGINILDMLVKIAGMRMFPNRKLESTKIAEDGKDVSGELDNELL